MIQNNWCDCGYIAPEVRASGHVCNRCKAIIVASQLSEDLMRKVSYMVSKGVPGFTNGDVAGLADLTNRLEEMVRGMGK